MRTKLRPDWYQIVDAGFDLTASGIYEWQIEGVGIYVGKAKSLRRRLKHYPDNVRRMIDGLHWHADPTKKYRRIHEALRQAYEAGVRVHVVILENCEPLDRAKRESFWIRKRRAECSNGGPQVLNSDPVKRHPQVTTVSHD